MLPLLLISVEDLVFTDFVGDRLFLDIIREYNLFLYGISSHSCKDCQNVSDVGFRSKGH